MEEPEPDLPLPDLESEESAATESSTGRAVPSLPLPTEGFDAEPGAVAPSQEALAFDDEPGLFAPAKNVPTLALETDGGATFEVTLRGFSGDATDAGARLAALLGLDRRTAETLVASAPVVVKGGVSLETASALEKELRALGAEVDVRPQTPRSGGDRSVGQSAASRERARQAIATQNAAAAQRVPLSAAAALAGMEVGAGPVLPEQDEPHPGFWARFPVAFAVPFLGEGVLWLGALVFAFFAAAILRLLCMGWLTMPLGMALYLGLLGSYFAQAAQTGLHDTGGGWPRPAWAPPRRDDLVYRGGAVLLLTTLLFALPAMFFLDGRETLAWVASIVPFAYWPMALTTVGLTGELVHGLNPITVLRGVRAAGLPYAVVVLVGLLAIGGLLLIVGWMLAAGPPIGTAGVVLFASGLGYVAGVQGYLMGCLVASRLDEFDDLIA